MIDLIVAFNRYFTATDFIEGEKSFKNLGKDLGLEINLIRGDEGPFMVLGMDGRRIPELPELNNQSVVVIHCDCKTGYNATAVGLLMQESSARFILVYNGRDNDLLFRHKLETMFKLVPGEPLPFSPASQVSFHNNYWGYLIKNLINASGFFKDYLTELAELIPNV